MQIIKDSRKKSIWKTLSYRISASLITAIIIYLFTGQIKISALIGGVDFLIKLIWYYVHERLWNHSDWSEILPKNKK